MVQQARLPHNNWSLRVGFTGLIVSILSRIKWTATLSAIASIMLIEATMMNGAHAAETGQNYLRISGTVALNAANVASSVRINPIQKLSQAKPSEDSGDYSLQMTTCRGKIHYIHFNPVTALAMDQATHHFNLAVPDVGPLRSVSFFHKQRRLKVQLLDRALQSKLVNRAGHACAEMDNQDRLNLTESEGNVTVQWPNDAYPWMLISFVDEQQNRTVLGLRIEGGTATFPTSALSKTGQWEISLSDGINSRLLRRPR